MIQREVLAVLLVAVLLGSPLGSTAAVAETVDGGTANVEQVGNAPAISVPDTTVAGGTGNVEVAYDVSGEIDPGDTTIVLSGPFGDREKEGVTDSKGKVAFSLPDRGAVGGYRIDAYLKDQSTGEQVARDRATVSEQSTAITDISVANTASGNNELLAGETFTVEATVDNQAESAQDVAVNLYGAYPDPQETVTVAGNSEAVVSLKTEAPESTRSGQTYITVNDRDWEAFDVNQPPEVSVSGTDVSVDTTGEINPGDTVRVSATVTNDESAYGKATVELKQDSLSTGKTQTVYLDAGESENVMFETSFDTTGEHTVSVAGNSATVTVSEPVAEVVSVEHVGGTAPDTDITAEDTRVTPPSGEGGLLQVDIEDDGSKRPQDLGSLGIDETTRFRVTLKVDDSYSPDVLIATAQSASWTVTEVSDEYEVTVEAQPLEAQYISPSPDHGSWPTGEDDQADYSYDPMFSLAFHSLEAQGATQDLSGAILATDAQRFGAPRYYKPSPDEDPVLELSVAGPHYTVDGSVNQGQYEAFLPETLLETWGVNGPDELEAAYQGENLELTAQEVERGMRISVPIHYSSGTVELSPADDDDSSGGSPSSGSASPAPSRETTTTTTAEPTTEATTTTEMTTETTTVADTTTAETTTVEATENTTTATERGRTTQGSADTPGFGPAVALVALAGGALLAGRRSGR